MRQERGSVRCSAQITPVQRHRAASKSLGSSPGRQIPSLGLAPWRLTPRPKAPFSVCMRHTWLSNNANRKPSAATLKWHGFFISWRVWNIVLLVKQNDDDHWDCHFSKWYPILTIYTPETKREHLWQRTLPSKSCVVLHYCLPISDLWSSLWNV